MALTPVERDAILGVLERPRQTRVGGPGAASRTPLREALPMVVKVQVGSADRPDDKTKPDLAFRAASSRTRSGCAQKEPGIRAITFGKTLVY